MTEEKAAEAEPAEKAESTGEAESSEEAESSGEAEADAGGDSDAPPKKASWKQRLEDHLREYGGIALVVYLVIWVCVWAGFAIAIAVGFSVDVGESGSSSGLLGVIGAAYIPTKLSQPLRIGATFVITPIVAGVWHRIRGKKVERE